MEKIGAKFIIDQYRSGISSYSDFAREVGLWDAEDYVLQKYIDLSDHILDLGCGAGRTTFQLYLQGRTNIIGVDLTPEMINEASRLNAHFKTNVVFEEGDAQRLAFDDETFDVVIFSFNGIMSIPGQSNRDQALLEISRVLKRGGTFIFTTHDRNREPHFFNFWKEEKLRWESGEQNSRLYEFGDLITTSKNETREIFIHIPDREEIEKWLVHHSFDIEETFYRSDLFEESEEVKAKSGECRFWMARKNIV